MKITLFYFCIMLTFCISCKTEQSKNAPNKLEEKQSPTARPFKISFETLKKTDSRCADQDECTKVNLKYPIASGGPQSLVDSVNYVVKESLLKSLESELSDLATVNDSLLLEHSAEQFIHNFIAFEKENQGEAFPWSFDFDSEVSYQSPENLTISLDFSTYAGGAHPNYYNTIYNFDKATGRRLQLNDLTNDMEAFKTLAKKAFLEEIFDKTEGDSSLTIDDFFWDKGFQFPQNFALGKESISFFYNPYEAAPYVFGSIEFDILKKDIKGFK